MLLKNSGRKWLCDSRTLLQDVLICSISGQLMLLGLQEREMQVIREQLSSKKHLINAVYSAHTATSHKYFQPCNLTP